MTRTVRLGDICDMRSGGTPRRGVDGYYGGTIPWVTIADMSSSDGVVRATAEKITEAGLAAIGNRVFEAGTILLAMYGSVGKLAVAGSRLATNQAILGLRPREPNSLEPRYLMRWLASIQTKLVFDARGVTQANISKGLVEELVVPLPELPEQRRIADILDKADAIRRKRKEAVALTEELLRSAFLEMFGDPVTNPKGWPVKALGELIATPLRNGLSPATGGKFAAQVLTLSAITRGQFDPSASKPGAFAVEPWDDVRVDARDFLICRGNGNVSLVGTAAFPRDSMNNIVFPDTMIAARIDQSRLRPAFLNAIWKSRFVRRQIEASARTTNGTFKINQTVVEGIEIVLPPPAKQQVFADFEARLAKTANNQHSAIERAEELFNALVARAFTGSLEAPC